MSDVARVESLVNELKAAGNLPEETLTDLDRFLADARAGTLWDDDYNYLVAFHAKMFGSTTEAPADADGDPTPDEWKSRALVAEARVRELEARLDAGAAAPPASP